MQVADILVIGGGPAGLCAAIEAGRLGAKVLLVDENDRIGGQLYKQIHKFFGSGAHYAGTRGFQIADILVEEGKKLGVEVSLSTRALGLMDNGNFSILRKNRVETVQAKKIILCTGGKENAITFPGWTLPGVMTAGAAQTFTNIHGMVPGNRILVVGSGNVGLIVSYQMMQAGAEIAALVEVMPNISGYQVHANKIKRAGAPVYLSHTVIEARGEGQLEEAVIAMVDEKFQPISGTEKVINVDTMLLAVGLTPRTELASMCGCRSTYESSLGGILPLHGRYMQSSRENVYVCGDLAGVEEANTAMDEGRVAGIHAAVSLGYTSKGALEKLEELQKSLMELRSGVNVSKRMAAKKRVIGKGDGINA